MTRDELRKEIAEIIDVSFVGIFYAPTPEDRERMILEYTDQIIALFDDYKSPEEFVRCPVCGEEYSANQLMECVEGWEEGQP